MLTLTSDNCICCNWCCSGNKTVFYIVWHRYWLDWILAIVIIDIINHLLPLWIFGLIRYRQCSLVTLQVSLIYITAWCIGWVRWPYLPECIHISSVWECNTLNPCTCNLLYLIKEVKLVILISTAAVVSKYWIIYLLIISCIILVFGTILSLLDKILLHRMKLSSLCLILYSHISELLISEKIWCCNNSRSNNNHYKLFISVAYLKWHIHIA